MRRLDDRLARDLRVIADHAPVRPAATWATIRARAEAETGDGDRDADVIMLEQPEHQPVRRRWVLVAAATIAAAVAGALFLLARDDESPVVVDPAPTSSPAPEPTGRRPVAEILDELAAAFEDGEDGDVLALLSPESDCDVPVPGGPRETCEQAVGFMLAIGARLDPRCNRDDPGDCSRSAIGSEVHDVMGHPDQTIPLPFVIDDDGLVEIRLGEANVFRAFVGTGGDTGRLWMALRDLRPDLSVSAQWGPLLNDREHGEALLEAAYALTEPVAIVESFESFIDRQLQPSHPPVRCETQFGRTDCAGLFDFLYALAADIGFDCSTSPDGTAAPAAVDRDSATCTVSITSDIHAALGSDPTTVPAAFSFRAGLIREFTFELRFAADPDVDDAFIEQAMTVDGLFRQIGASDQLTPVFTEESAAAWLAVAADFAATPTD